MSVFFCKKFAFFCQKSRFTPSNSVRAVLEIFWSCFQFLSDKRLLLLKILLMQTLYPESSLWTNWPEIRKMTMTSQFFNMTSSSNVFDVPLFLLSRLATGPSFMSISSLVLELSQFSFIRDWPEIRKSGIPLSEFCPISGDWGKLWVPNLARMYLTECYYMLQNSTVTAFTVLELSTESQLRRGGSKITHPSPTLIRVNVSLWKSDKPVS